MSAFRRCVWALCFAVLISASVVLALGETASEFSLVSQGWRVVEKDGKKGVEVSALVRNDSKSPLTYEVRFIVESREHPRSDQPRTSGGASDQQPWTTLSTVPVRGGPLAPGASAPAKTVIPHALLAWGREYRYRAELVDLSSGAVVGAAALSAVGKASAAAAAAAGAAAAVGAAAALGGGGGSSDSDSGSGTMAGTHEARWVDGEWVEHGSGTIDVTTGQGRMVLEYTYDSHGPSAAELRATATASGELTPTSGTPLAVEITSASAETTAAGTRVQTGSTVRRTGSTATGTFSGTVGGRPWTGLLTMTEGDMTLDLNSGLGEHQYRVRFTASR